ncbi:MAG: efflux RND transporter permease subunit, partial [Planctomycetaceae bacterium]|nr:efflux RND transporter permease subunit [Planctomycetaceae bacterium]
LEPLRNGIIKYVNGTPIYVKDVADIHMVLKKNSYFNQSKGQSSMIFAFKRETGANVLTVIKEIKRVMKELDTENGPFAQYKNDRYQIRPRLAYDDSMYIDKAIALVKRNLYEGSILAVIILLIFLRSTRPTLIIALSIPISILGTFVVLYAAGRNINIISMAGLTFAVGMVVDDAIVVLENIDRHLHMGKTPFKAAYEGAREVWGAVLSATLTTAAVFAPILTIQEEAGQLYYDIGIAISAAIIFSLLVSITVIPALAVNTLESTDRPRSAPIRAFKALFGLAPLCRIINDGFARFLYYIMAPNLSGVSIRIIFSALITLISLYLCYIWMPPASYLPNGNKNYVSSVVNTPPATSYRQNVYMGQVLQDSLRPYWEAESRNDLKHLPPIVDIRTGREISDIAPIRETWTVFTTSGMRVMAMSQDNQNVQNLVALLNSKINQLPGVTGMATQSSIFGRRSAGNQLQVEVTGTDMVRLRDSTAYFEKRLIGIFSQAGVRTSPPNYRINGPEFQLVIDQPKAKELGIGLSQIGLMVRSLIDGTYSGDYDFEGDNIDLYVIRDPDIPLTPHNVADLPIAVKVTNNTEMIIPLSEIVKFKHSESSQQIRRYEQQRAIQILVSTPDEMSLETVQDIVYKTFEECKAEGGVTPDTRIILAGSADKLMQTRQAMLGKWTGFNGESIYSLLTSRFFLALLIVYLLLAALFESFLYPFVIMFSVPLAMTGGILGLAFVNYLDPTQQMDTLAMLGFVILIGIVVRNAILIVHQTLNFIRGYGESEEEVLEKFPYREAVCESVRTRMRPIFMTSLAMIFGMLPLVYAHGEGSELYRGLGAVVLGGLVCSTIFTLFLIPMLFSLVLDAQHMFKKEEIKAEKL